MEITSGSFVVFLLLSLVVYYVLARRPQNYWLLLVSYIFCISWAWHFALVLLLVTVVNFWMARRVRVEGQGRKAYLWAGIGFNVLILVVFRLSDFYVTNLEALMVSLGLSTELGVLQILLPVGLSFYIVENIAYQVDVYRGQTAASGDIVDYALYQAYFPKLLAGPIERAGSFLPKLAAQRIVDNEVLARSFTLIVVGVFRKLIIADTLTAAIPWDVFEAPSNFWAGELWGWLIVYGFALYNDFAGYTSLVRGVSGLFGIELSPNFRQPYLARNFGEFWNSWHITLSHWLRDYIYFPVQRALLRRNRSRRNILNIVVPPFATMLVSGLWHGFSMNMLVWGGLHGAYLVGERLLSLTRPVVAPDHRPRLRQLLAMAVVFVLAMLAWVPFRVEMPVAVEYWEGLVSWGGFALRYRRIVPALMVVALSLTIDWVQYRSQTETVFLRWPRPVQAALLAAVTFLILIISQTDYVEPFVYQGF